nr:MAG TPA: hypothetical protein [Caudoviricetes sp.]
MPHRKHSAKVLITHDRSFLQGIADKQLRRPSNVY